MSDFLDQIPTDLDAALVAVDDAIEARLPYVLPLSICSSGEHEWATDAAIEGILNLMDPDTIAAMIIDQWEPSDDEMMAAFGTAWHDGL
jgi:hypothetical protein